MKKLDYKIESIELNVRDIVSIEEDTLIRTMENIIIEHHNIDYNLESSTYALEKTLYTDIINLLALILVDNNNVLINRYLLLEYLDYQDAFNLLDQVFDYTVNYK